MGQIAEKGTTTFSDIQKDAFRHARNHLTYDDMHIIRDDISEFMRERSISHECIGMILLSVTEILSNLIKHPAVKTDYLEIRIRLDGCSAYIDVQDNSTPFAHFEEKCRNARQTEGAALSFAENGYGLGCILKTTKSAAYTPLSKSDDGFNHFKMVCEIKYDEMENRAPKEKIFLIDDDPIALQIHQRMLGDAYDVLPIDGGQKALDLFPHHRPDLIISDITMPEMDGIDLRKALSLLEGGEETPFIFLSGLKDQKNSLYISSLGIDDFLCKPVSTEKLSAVVKRLIRRSAQVKNRLQGKYHQEINTILSPSLPRQVKNWKFCVHHQPSEVGGGDFILHEEMENGVTVIFSDVMGHGLSAKFFSYAYAGYIRSLMRLYKDISTPALLLQKLSALVEQDELLENVILTCQCFQFFSDGRVSVASAGHPPPLLIRNGQAAPIEVFGPLPGLIENTAYPEKPLLLQKGDTIAFMSDGFLESFGRKGNSSEKILSALHTCPPGKPLCDHLWSESQTHRSLDIGEKDDVTFITAEYGGIS